MFIILEIILVSIQWGGTLGWYKKKGYYKRIMPSWWNSIQSTIHTLLTFPGHQTYTSTMKQAQNNPYKYYFGI